jgi:hypothetical protein
MVVLVSEFRSNGQIPNTAERYQTNEPRRQEPANLAAETSGRLSWERKVQRSLGRAPSASASLRGPLSRPRSASRTELLLCGLVVAA